MTRLIDAVMEFWDWLMRVFGFRRSAPEGVPEELRKGSRTSRALRWFWPVLLILLVVYFGVMIWRFAFIRGDDLSYPQEVLGAVETTQPPSPAPAGTGDGPAPTAAEAQRQQRTCAPSQTVKMQQALIDIIVNRNDWAPAAPMYTIGVFGLVDWADTPWFDNKAAFQLGVLDILRRIGLELTDTMGRVRGTSAADSDLQGAQSRLRVNERAWIFNNPFDPQLNTISVAAGASYRGAIGLYDRYNARLASCEALFDVRADSLRTVLDRMSKDLGSTTDQLAQRGQGEIYDPNTNQFVQGPGNNRGWFDFRADNVFHRARGQMFALHGLMQGVRADYREVIERRDLVDIWNRMEAHIAEAAALEPLIVSNGRADGILMPNHLAAMSDAMFRARSNMVELREVLDR